MTMPGFTADISLHRGSGQYYLTLSSVWGYGIHPFLRCGGLGQPCCHAPFQNVPAFGPLVSCEQGLGCDITINKCVSPCGGPGQVCCDGPQTRAPKWTADGKVYSPNTWDMQEMCSAGACERQTHRCFACGTAER